MNLLLDLYLTWFKLGLFTFGGGYAMLPLIQREIIDNKKWATEEEVMNYYAIGQITPGIIAVNTATFIGYYKKGIIGGIIATLGVISPSLIIITLIADLINNFSELIIVQHALSGIKVAVTCLMLIAINNLYKSNVKDKASLIIAISTFVLSYFTSISTTLLVVSAGVVGIVFTKLNLFSKDKS
jgi:chromate transporter